MTKEPINEGDTCLIKATLQDGMYRVEGDIRFSAGQEVYPYSVRQLSRRFRANDIVFVDDWRGIKPTNLSDVTHTPLSCYKKVIQLKDNEADDGTVRFGGQIKLHCCHLRLLHAAEDERYTREPVDGDVTSVFFRTDDGRKVLKAKFYDVESPLVDCNNASYDAEDYCDDCNSNYEEYLINYYKSIYEQQ